MHPDECYRRLFPFLGHKWTTIYWDKFGTGCKDQAKVVREYCRKVK